MPLSYYGNIYTLHRQLFPIRCPVMEHVAMQKMYIFVSEAQYAVDHQMFRYI